MQNLIAEYLLENKQCFIPSLGVLSLKKTTAAYDFSEQSMAAPKHTLYFEKKDFENESLVQFVAAKKSISIADAKNFIADFSASVNILSESDSTEIKGFGHFIKNTNGKIEFKALEINDAFYPTVQAVKVVHPNATHNMTVGDTETDTASMTEYFAEDEVVAKDKWWLWAAIFSILSVAGFLYFIFGTKPTGIGNFMPLQKNTAEKTFTLPK